MMSDISHEKTDAKPTSVEARIEARLAKLEMAMKTGFPGSRIEMERLRREMHRANPNSVKRGLALCLAVVGTTASVLHFISTTP